MRVVRRLLLVVAALVVLSAAMGGCGPAPVEFPNGYVTGYTFWDNNPPGSADICCPVIHDHAAGNGTFGDPITVAVDYVQQEGGQVMQFSPGTIFYIPNLRAYFIVEDRTGELAQTNSANHHGTTPHLDVWADGSTSTATNADQCVRSFTDEGLRVIENPANNYRVVVGPLAHDNTCRPNFGNTVVFA